MDEWRATIQSLIGFAEAGGSQRADLPRHPQATTTARPAGRAKGANPMMQSPMRQLERGLRLGLRDKEPDEVSMALSYPRARRD